MQAFVAELKRRGVFYGAAYYAAGAWLVVQVATSVFPYLEFPAWSVRLVIVVAIAGFPAALLVSWFYDWTPKGLRRDAADEAGALPAAARDAAPAPANSIAVLPFADMSQAKDQEYFSDGLSEELLNLLAQLPQLHVIARTSSFSFKGKTVDVATIARALNVAHVLEGSVRKSGNRLRVTATLIRASDSAHVFSQNYERELTDVFEVQDEIAGAVVAALKVKLLPEQHLTNAHRTASTEAYEQYLLGQSVIRRGRYDEYRHARQAFERALALDPGYAAAAAGLATAISAAADLAASPDERAAAKRTALEMAERAIALAPDLADGYVVRGQLRHRQYWDWQGGIEDLRRALELEPNRSEVAFAAALGLYSVDQSEQALPLARKATAADPLSWPGWAVQGALLLHLGRPDEGRAALDRALEISPDSSVVRSIRGDWDLVDGRLEQALAHYRKAGAAHGLAGIAKAEHSLGHASESDAALAELEAKYAIGFSYQIAEVHAWRGDIDAAFEWLERACALRDSGIPRIRFDNLFDPIKGDPRYAALMQRLNFPTRDETGP